jgi:hypothetical protein
MHLGLKTGPLCPLFCTNFRSPVPLAKFQIAPINLWEPCYSTKVPDDPQTYTLDVLWLQEEEEEEEEERGGGEGEGGEGEGGGEEGEEEEGEEEEGQ